MAIMKIRKPRETQAARASKLQKQQGQEDPSQPFRFLDLPPELRNRIYYYFFVAIDDVWLAREIDNRKPGQASRLALLQTCRLVHKEAEAIPYASNHLCIDGKDLGSAGSTAVATRRLSPPKFLNTLSRPRFEGLTSLTVWMAKQYSLDLPIFRQLKHLPALQFLHLGLEWQVASPMDFLLGRHKFDFSVLVQAVALEEIEISGTCDFFPMTVRSLESKLQAGIDGLRACRKVTGAVEDAWTLKGGSKMGDQEGLEVAETDLVD